jgi:RNA polymerase sigma-70 factor (ECF subfamily)
MKSHARIAIIERRNRVMPRVLVMRRVLRELSPREREAISRFYLKEQTQAQICSEMALTKIQFQLLKSRAKARFDELSRN